MATSYSAEAALPACREKPVSRVWDTNPVWSFQLCGIFSLLCTVSEDVEGFIVFFFAWLLPYEWPYFHRPDTGLAIKLLAYRHTNKHLCYREGWQGVRELGVFASTHKTSSHLHMGTVAIQLKAAHTDRILQAIAPNWAFVCVCLCTHIYMSGARAN